MKEFRLNKRPEAGFTLIEVMMVVLIMGIVATIGMPVLRSGLDESRLSGAATEIVIALEFAQMTAMTTGAQIRVTIDDAAESILIERFETGTDLLGIETELDEDDVEGGAFATMKNPQKRGEDYSITFSDEGRFDGVDIVSSVFGVDNYVTFDTMGSPSGGGTVILSYGSGQITVSVDALTGKVTASS